MAVCEMFAISDRRGTRYSPQDQLREAEGALLGYGWSKPREVSGVWLSAPPGYDRGFIAGLTEQAAEWQRRRAVQSRCSKYGVDRLIWA
jgi:hypothetical protein